MFAGVGHKILQAHFAFSRLQGSFCHSTFPPVCVVSIEKLLLLNLAPASNFKF